MRLPELPKLQEIKIPEIRMPDPSRAMRRKTEPEPDPLANVEYTDSAEENLKRELTALEEGYRTRAKNEEKRFKEATDSEYWFAVCFESREEKEAFLKAINHPSKLGDKYIDGRDLAHTLGIEF